jgi:PAS domain S-box-containing protein
MDDPDAEAVHATDEIERLKKTIAALQTANQDLERLLVNATSALQKCNTDLLERTAELIRLENQSHTSLTRYHTLITTIPGAVYRCANDDAWTMEYISDWITLLTGYSATDFIRNAVRTYASVIHPDDVIHVFKAVQDGLDRREPYEIEYRLRHRDGSIRRVYEKGQGVFDNQGRFLYLDGVIFDLSEGSVVSAINRNP